jgi:uncharacterized protein YndB with AHSA1/START domain
MATAAASSQITLQIKRVFPSSRERVFHAWTNIDELALWFAPSDEYTVVIPEFDFRVGGRYRLEMHHQGGNVHRVTGVYREITPPEKIVFTWQWQDNHGNEETLVTIDLRTVGNSTALTLTHERFSAMEERDKHTHGWNGCLDRLAKVV